MLQPRQSVKQVDRTQPESHSEETQEYFLSSVISTGNDEMQPQEIQDAASQSQEDLINVVQEESFITFGG